MTFTADAGAFSGRASPSLRKPPHRQYQPADDPLIFRRILSRRIEPALTFVLLAVLPMCI